MSAKDYIAKENVTDHPTLHSWMESYHQHQLTALRAEVEALRDAKLVFEPTVDEKVYARALNGALALFDKHIKP